MDILALSHLLVLGLWGGVVAAEVILEVGGLTGRFEDRFVADFHAATDRFLELPLLALLIATGAMLWQRTGWSPDLYPKVGFGLGAVFANVANAFFVHRRFGGKKEAVPYVVILAATVTPGVLCAGAAIHIAARRIGWW